MGEVITDFATTIEAWLFQDNMSLTMLFIGIVLLAYLLEDLAIVTAATLAVEKAMPTSLALTAIFVGIITGDFGLYFIGKTAQKVRLFRYRLFRHSLARMMKRRLHKQVFFTLFIVRFIPGLRTVGFTLSGFLDVPKTKFFFTVVTATGLWTILVFGSFFQLGTAQWFQDNQISWLLIPLGFCLILLLNKLVIKVFFKGCRDAHDSTR
ncbi:DedA family protein [Parashewanella tropica]|uniref:DedA family protein n=1 Tax=Parashewanella tropica TaxID=2547970 RepID=UPI001C554FBA|nr:VTT domain-containing protein [Parashewanella tropica]